MGKSELSAIQRSLSPGQACSSYWAVSNCLANKTLSARLALLDGQGDQAVALLTQGAVEEAHVPYDEPPPWHYPTRECLGAVLLNLGRAAEAEAVYREDIKIWRNNAWSLRGLADAMSAQPTKYSHAEVVAVLKQSQQQWARGDRSLTSSCMAFDLDIPSAAMDVDLVV